MSWYPPGPAGGAPGPMAGPAPVRLRDHRSGPTVLILGFLSLYGLFPLGIVAWAMANNALKEVDADRYAWNNRGSLVVGRVLGAVGAVVSGLFVMLIVTTIWVVANGTEHHVDPKTGKVVESGAVAVHPHADLPGAFGPPAAA